MSSSFLKTSTLPGVTGRPFRPCLIVGCSAGGWWPATHNGTSFGQASCVALPSMTGRVSSRGGVLHTVSESYALSILATHTKYAPTLRCPGLVSSPAPPIHSHHRPARGPRGYQLGHLPSLRQPHTSAGPEAFHAVAHGPRRSLNRCPGHRPHAQVRASDTPTHGSFCIAGSFQPAAPCVFA